jgi:hypothetical protein
LSILHTNRFVMLDRPRTPKLTATRTPRNDP